MSRAAEIILAIGAAPFLAGLIFVTAVWSFRCKPDAPTYRNPLMVFGVPAALGFLWALHQLMS